MNINYAHISKLQIVYKHRVLLSINLLLLHSLQTGKIIFTAMWWTLYLFTNNFIPNILHKKIGQFIQIQIGFYYWFLLSWTVGTQWCSRGSVFL